VEMIVHLFSIRKTIRAFVFPRAHKVTGRVHDATYGVPSGR
jgi:hypothetical protein